LEIYNYENVEFQLTVERNDFRVTLTNRCCQRIDLVGRIGKYLRLNTKGKNNGKPYAGKLHAWFNEGAMVTLQIYSSKGGKIRRIKKGIN